jgi:hypothetical protein
MLVITPAPTVGQAGGLEGRVWDPGGAPVYAAAVQLTPADGVTPTREAETNRVGYFRIEDLAPGAYMLRAVRLGFQEATREVVIRPGGRTEVNLTLVVAAVEVEGVAVEAERSRERARFADEAGVTVRELAAAELKLIPGLAESDPVRAVELLPGVISTSDFSSAFNVRGGSADQNLILLDGLPILSPFHLGGLFSVFNSDMVGRAELRSGGFPAEFGGRVSSVLNIETDPGTGNFRGDAALSLLASRLALGGGVPDAVREGLGLRSARWRASARRSYFDQVLKPVFEFPYHLIDLQGIFEAWTAGGSRFSLTGYTGDDVLRLTSLDDEDFPLRVDWRWGNDLLGGRFTIPRSGGGMVELRAGVSRFGTGLRFPDFDDSEFRSRITQVFFGTDAEHRLGRHWHLKGGVALDRLSYDNLAVSGGTEFAGGRGSGWLVGSYLQGEWRRGEEWIVELGTRLDSWSPSPGEQQWVLSPRMAAKRFLGDGDLAIKIAAGRYAQFLHSLRDEELPLGLDVWVLAGERAPHVESDQVQLGVEGFLGDGWFASLEGYARGFEGVITNNLADDPNDELDDLVAGDGFSYGADLYVRRSAPGLNGWITISWLKSERTFPDFRSGFVPAPSLTYPPLFDRRLDVDLVVRYPLPWGLQGGFRWNFGSGLPFTRPLGAYTYLAPELSALGRLVWQVDEEGDDDFTAFGVALGPRNGQRYPAYHRLDVSFRKSFTKSWGRLIPYVDVLNVYNRKNVLFYFFEYDEQPPVRSGISMFPILPSFGLEVSF